MRIVHVVPYAMDRPGGVQTHVRDLCAWLDGQGHAARIVAARGRSPAPGNVHSLGRSATVALHGTRFELSFATPDELRTLSRDLAGFGAELLHLHTPWVPAIPWQVWRRMRLPAVATVHATLPDPPDDLLSRLLLGAARRWTRRLDAIIVPSEVPRAQWQARNIEPLPRSLAPAIDLRPWRAAGDERPPPSGPISNAVCVGRLEGRKGLETVLAAWPRVRAVLPGLLLALIGRGTPPGPLPDGVSVVTAAGDAELRCRVAKADLLIAPAGFGESFGIVLAEAMAAGTPVLAAANPAYEAMLGPGAEAQLFPPGDASALAARVVEMSNAPDLRARIARRGRSRARRADLADVGPDYLALYAEVLARSNRDGCG